ncbi:MAG: hypothetical protein J6U80_03500 [Bacteroidales bacterium]|nr:hypothetical protein [Bacteroidales bacterium]
MKRSVHTESEMVKAVQFGEPLEAASDEYDHKASYDAKNGAPKSVAPKVLIKYFFVNKTTGEKSGDMLAAVKLTEDAASGEQ